MSLLMLIGIGVLLVASVVFSSLLSRLIPQGGWVTPVVNLIVNLLLFTLIFMVMFTVLPDVKISWKTTFIGGLITALLFVAGQYGISRYLATKGSSSVYGAAGFMIILLLWIYYTGMIVLFGAELTRDWFRQNAGADQVCPVAVGRRREAEGDAVGGGKSSRLMRPSLSAAFSGETSLRRQKIPL